VDANKGISVRLIIHSHTFTSPDAPVNEPDNDIPQRFIDGCDGDMDEARKRWDLTRHWRETEGTLYPFFLAGNSDTPLSLASVSLPLVS
jgi:hypothetical protein